jgi:membrane protein implicated in regulation of membrane protease activity
MDKFLARVLFIIGLLLIFAAFLIAKGVKMPFGRLPGDIIIRRPNFSFYFPVTTSIIISIILSFIFLLLWRR